MQSMVFQPVEKWPVGGSYDVVVVGAGPGGIAAAVAAARGGARVVVLEKQGYAGGVAVGSLVPNIMGLGIDGKVAVGGIATELLRNVGLKGEAQLKTTPYKNIGKDTVIGATVICNTHALAVEASALLEEAGVVRLFHTNLIGAVTEGARVTAVAVNGVEGAYLLKANVFVDATGDALLAQAAGAVTVEAGADQAMTKTLIFDVGGVKDFSRARSEADFAAQVAAGTVPVEIQDKFMGYSILHPGEVQLNFTAVTGDALSSVELTRMDYTLRCQIDQGLAFFRKYMTGFEDCYLVRTPNTIGVRAGRAVVGLEMITQRDIDEQIPVSEPVAVGLRRYGDHGIKGFGSEWARPVSGARSIPWKCLISKSFVNLAMAGRSISCEPAMITCIRYMAQCMATGQAAGSAAALSLKQSDRGNLTEVVYSELRGKLLADGAILELS